MGLRPGFALTLNVRRSPVAVLLLADNPALTQAAPGVLSQYFLDLLGAVNNRFALKRHGDPS
jgi:hypothetical protein